MKTDDLIAILGTNVEPVDPRRLARSINISVAAGIAAAVLTMVFALGVRSGITEARAVAFLGLKLAFTIGIVVLAANFVVKLARPGGEWKVPLAFIAAPFVGIMVLAAISLANAPSKFWKGMIVGDQWVECLLSVPIIAIVPFAVTVWAVRQAAPTDLRRAGALAGLLAGAVSATAYALHCVDDSVPFVAVWYGGTIALCTIAGATLGPRLLRW